MSMRICKIKNCNNQYHAKGLCSKHYHRFVRHNNPFHVEREMHGMRHTSEYNIWNSMIARCTRENTENYYRYGGRGITICSQWLKSFKTFFEDMGPKPFSKAEIDRINNDLGYYPQNCHWTTHEKNCQNRPTTKLTMQKAEAIRIKYRSENITQMKLAAAYNVSHYTISDIIYQRRWKT